MLYPKRYEAIVIGGGHAGCEAAHALASMGVETLMLTMNIDTIGHMSCNPAIGGVAKGHLAKEIDALGGVMGQVTDASAIQYRRLNTRKGPAVWSSRAQCDMRAYRANMQQLMMNLEGLDIKQGSVEDLELCEDASGKPTITGVRTTLGVVYAAQCVVITAGTFLRGLCHVGLENFKAGRAGSEASVGLAHTLARLKLEMGRLKTGTTPRLDANTIDWGALEVQPGDVPPRRFSFYHHPPMMEQVPCYITHTNERTHQVILANTSRSPMFTGKIEGIGARYCPSIEDKVTRFAHKTSHQIFLEPQGLDTVEIYPSGLSTSLPLDVQIEMVRSVVGLERAEIMRPGYAVEYDYVNPIQLAHTLELRGINGLFLAGQINGTSGYEEAGAQGLVAGINAGLKIQRKDPFILGREEAYIGVMVDDLVTLGVDEPYRMFTSRAEHRLVLREDNADMRLSEYGWRFGLLSDAQIEVCRQKRTQIEQLAAQAQALMIGANAQNRQIAHDHQIGSLGDGCTLEAMLRRPEHTLYTLAPLITHLLPELDLDALDPAVAEAVEIRAKYAGYIDRQQRLIDQQREMESHVIPGEVDYQTIHGLSWEVRQRLDKVRPRTIGQASRIPGVTAAAMSALMLHLRAA